MWCVCGEEGGVVCGEFNPVEMLLSLTPVLPATMSL